MAEADHKPDFCVVGIGASSGGLNALRDFFTHTPAAPGFACVVVMHLSPEHESHLEQLLQPHTQMRVRQVLRTTALEPNCVYVIPPNANLESIDTHLRLSELEAQRRHRAPIDHFLSTLAATHGDSSIGVILSGAGSDGASGARQIRKHGGLTLAQDPHEAEYASMPESAIATGAVDLVMPVREMAAEITSYCATHPRVAAPDGDDAVPDEEAALLEKILAEVRLRTGQDFALYTRAVLLQRVRRRMRLRRVETLDEYLEALRRHEFEPRALHDDLLLSVTEFFRDEGKYQALKQAVEEILGREDGRGRRVRAWVVGCSSGEEAYCLAMLLAEHSTQRGDDPRLQVFASDLSASALQQAREGVYPQEIATAVSAERLERFFLHEGGHYRARRELRDLVTFASHDLFADPPYSHLDLIVCRDLLHELRADVRRGALSLFYYALAPHGILVSDGEEPIEASGLFVRDAGNARVMRRVSGPKQPLELPSHLKPFGRLSGQRAGQAAVSERFDNLTLFRAAMDRYAPASVLVDSHNRVVHSSAAAARYVSIPGGELTLDILRLVPEELREKLSQGLDLVRHGLRSWQSDPFAMAAQDGERRIVVHVDRPDAGGRVTELLLVVFADAAATALPRSEGLRAPGVKTARGRRSREALRTVTEELQSAREELQAVNEELSSLNEENQYRIEALAQASNDLQHLLDSTGLATLLVDRALKVVRFTSLVTEVFPVRDSDVGRPLSDIKHRLHHQALMAEVREVVESAKARELEAESADGRSYLVRIQPYRSALRGLEGAVLVVIDITVRKHAEMALREADRRKDEFLAILAHELRNPLAPIGAGIEVLRKVPDNPALTQQVTATMARQTRQLVRLVDDLLEVSRISRGKLSLRRKPVRSPRSYAMRWPPRARSWTPGSTSWWLWHPRRH